MHLNEAQKQAVETTEGPLLIIAGAGAGKTGVLTHRILNLIKKGNDPQSILAITFTNKAASEMKKRVSDLLGQDSTLNKPLSRAADSTHGKPFVSTFHALGVHIIRENAVALGLSRHFTIYDRSDSKRAIKEAMERLSIDPKAFDPGTALNTISRAKGDGLSVVEYKDKATDRSGGYFEETIASIWEIYDSILAKEKSLDFDDLLLKTAQLLERPEIRRHYANVWKYVHIDEYQDTNRVQYLIAKRLAEQHRNICVVGDADQNIYSWRGATIENILNFETDYPDAKVITLEKNYRSTKIILDAANAVIEKNTLRKKKHLYTDNVHGDKISLIVSYTGADEARSIADEARSLVESGTEPRNIAVLYRTNFQSRALEEFFIKKHIPYQLLGTRFFERKEVKDALSYIRAALNPDAWGDIARCINSPTRGIGKATLAKLALGQEGSLPSGMKQKVAQFRALLGDIRREINEKKPSESMKFVIQESGMEKAFQGHHDSEDEERLFNLRELVSVAAQYDHLKPEEGMTAFLENAALATDQDELTKDHNGVKLMTVHAAKGLEFDYVFIAGLEQDLFPLRHADDGDMTRAQEEEERRLFYVALTRARKKVYLSYAMIRTIYGAERVSAPSEFLGDISSSLIDEHRPPEAPTGAKAIFIDF